MFNYISFTLRKVRENSKKLKAPLQGLKLLTIQISTLSKLGSTLLNPNISHLSQLEAGIKIRLEINKIY